MPLAPCKGVNFPRVIQASDFTQNPSHDGWVGSPSHLPSTLLDSDEPKVWLSRTPALYRVCPNARPSENADAYFSRQITELQALATLAFAGATPTELRTLITPELLKKKMLGANAIYLSLAHDDDVIARCLAKLDRILADHRDRFPNRSITQVLIGGTIQQGFARLA